MSSNTQAISHVDERPCLSHTHNNICPCYDLSLLYVACFPFVCMVNCIRFSLLAYFFIQISLHKKNVDDRSLCCIT